jgi:hypothetical protein
MHGEVMRFEQGAPADVKRAVPMVQNFRNDRAPHVVLPVTSAATMPSAATATATSIPTPTATFSVSVLPRQSELRSYLRELAATRR